MRLVRRTAVLTLLVLFVGVTPGWSQAVATTPQPTLSAEEMEAFLTNGRIIAKKTERKGVTDAYRVTLTDGKTTHDAQVQDVDIYAPIFDAGAGVSEVNFRDTYRYNIAAYRLARFLGLTNVPMSVLRTVDAKPAAVTWWIDNVQFTENDRLKKKATGPNPSRMAGYVHILRVFDELIQNRDRNGGNYIWTEDWTMWMIDHTRAFRTNKSLLKPQLLERCERTLCARMRLLTRESLVATVGDTLLPPEVDGVIARRDAILKLFDAKIAKTSEASVYFTQPRQ